MPKRPPRKRDPLGRDRGYQPADDAPTGYLPQRRTRRAPHAFWRRNPFPDDFGFKMDGKPHSLREDERVRWTDIDDYGDYDYEDDFWDFARRRR